MGSNTEQDNTKKTNGGNQDSEPRDDQGPRKNEDQGAAMEGVDGHDNNDHDGNRHRGNNTGEDDTRRGGGNSGAGKSGTEGLGTEKSKDGMGSEKPGQR